MDSVTQIVLGASVGEAVLGKKLGNRAMIWGGIAGTIPDLDVIFGSIFLDEIQSLAFHRGISHSFFFALLAPLGLAGLAHYFYKNGVYQSSWYRKVSTVFPFLFVLISGLFLFALSYIHPIPLTFFIFLFGIVPLISMMTMHWPTMWWKRTEPIDIPSYPHWYLFFFLTIVTHPILDAFTTYGTQLFQPFSNERVAWNSISVADPYYTIPFMVCLVAASLFRRKSRWRTAFNVLGLVLSTGYLAWGLNNKVKVETAFQDKLKTESREYSRILVTPTIFNNFLWNCTADSDTAFYRTLIHIGDVDDEPQWTTFPKDTEIEKPLQGSEAFNTLRWFSDDYYNIVPYRDDTLQYNDLRYGIFSDSLRSQNDYIFKFKLWQSESGAYEIEEVRDEMELDQFDFFFEEVYPGE